MKGRRGSNKTPLKCPGDLGKAFPWRENWDFFVRKFGDLEERRFPRTTANLSTSWLQWENFLKKMIEIEVKVSCSLSSFLLNYIIECEIVKNVKD